MAETIAAGVAAAGSAAAAAPYAATLGSLASAGMAVASSQAQAAALRNQAAQRAVQAQQEALRGQTEANQVRSALLRTLSAQNARAGAAGLALDDGLTATLATEAARQAEIELGIRRGNSAGRVADTLFEGSLLQDRADSTATAGLARGAIGIFDAADRWFSRRPGGVTPPPANASAALRDMQWP